MTARVHTDTCARCGCDRKEQRRGKFRCMAMGVLYGSHRWGWDEGLVAATLEAEGWQLLTEDFYCERCREACNDRSYEPLCPDCYWDRFHEEDRGGR